MKKLIPLVVVVLGIALWLGNNSSFDQAVVPSKRSEESEKASVKPVVISKATAVRSPASSSSASAGTVSVHDLASAVAQNLKGPTGLRDLLDNLKKTGQEPFVVHDSNPDTGEMVVVRTKAPLADTRYFHAQFFSNESGEPFIQHASFEIKAGPEAMNTALAAVERNFAGLSRPVVQREDYVKWKLGEDYIIWIKKMTADDLKDDPFNAYTAADSGTVRVAIEQEIH